MIRQICICAMKNPEDMMDFLQSNDFRLQCHTIVRQITAENHHEYFEKIKLRGLSDLASLADEEFYEGLARLEKYCCDQNTSEPIFEDIDLFIFGNC